MAKFCVCVCVILASLVGSSLNAMYGCLKGDLTEKWRQRTQYRGTITPEDSRITRKPVPIFVAVVPEKLLDLVAEQLKRIENPENENREYKHKWDGMKKNPQDVLDNQPSGSLKGNVQAGIFDLDEDEGFAQIILPKITLFERRRLAYHHTMHVNMLQDDFLTAAEDQDIAKALKLSWAIAGSRFKWFALKFASLIVVGSRIANECKKGRSVKKQVYDVATSISSLARRVVKK